MRRSFFGRDFKVELFWRTFASLMLNSVPSSAPPSSADPASPPNPSQKDIPPLPSRFSLVRLRLALQTDHNPSFTPSGLFNPLTAVMLALVWFWDMLTAHSWTEEEQMGRGVLRREWVPREVWEEGVMGKKDR